jgi:nitronate monooxygenase
MRGDPILTQRLKAKLRIPVMAGPMFIASTPALVVAQCRSGIIGSMPALNARATDLLDEQIASIEGGLEGCEVPFAINLVAHKSNARLDADLEIVVARKVPIVVLALATSPAIVEAIHRYGGLVFNDVASDRHALKCAELGVDGMVAISAGAGGHTGSVSPFALVGEIREWWEGPLMLAGSIATGRAILAAETLGADLAYIGSPFLACAEANTPDGFKQMVVASASKDIVVTNGFTGANASFLLPSILANGLDPVALAKPKGSVVDVSGGGSNAKAWRDVWSAGQGIGAVKATLPAADYIAGLAADYERARAAMGMGRP